MTRMAIPSIPTTVLVAPAPFDGKLNTAEVAAAIGRGLERAGLPVDLCPVEEGEDGTPLVEDTPIGHSSFDARMRGALAVVTGEARLDQRSLAGKPLSEVATRARQAGVPCYAVVGSRTLDSFGARVLDLQVVIEAGTVKQLEAAGQRLAPLLRP
jgi:glycerate kinase